MDEVSSRAVREAFARLYREGLAYRHETLINWCPGCRTSLSDLEVIATPETGTLWTIRYHLVDPATGGPSRRRHHRRDDPARDDPRRHAVAVHPDDPRYRDAGRAAASASRSSNRDVPIIADPVVDRPSGPAR